MVIRFTSTLTADDESRFASALLTAVGHLLAPFPISYAIRIETIAGDVVEDGQLEAGSDSRPGSESHTGYGTKDRRTR